MHLSTPRLHLRRLRDGDAAALCAYRALPEVARFQSWTTFGPADAEKLIASQSLVLPNTPGTWMQLAITLRDGGGLIGDCGIHFVDDQQVELGITMSPAHQGRGLAAEALAAVIGHLFDSLEKHRIFAITDAENHAAAKLFRRLGFRLEAHHIENIFFKNAWGSEFVFAILRSEWTARK